MNESLAVANKAEVIRALSDGARVVDRGRWNGIALMKGNTFVARVTARTLAIALGEFALSKVKPSFGFNPWKKEAFVSFYDSEDSDVDNDVRIDVPFSVAERIVYEGLINLEQYDIARDEDGAGAMYCFGIIEGQEEGYDRSYFDETDWKREPQPMLN
jgi:hypothetical protein